MEESTLQLLWYFVVGLSMIMYTVLDGFDLGVGSLHLFARNDAERRVFLNAIGPVWDGNEVWLVVIIGALFAGFPPVYATVFSGFYTLLTILIACYMFRAAAIEFRSKREGKKWRYTWDAVFSLASMVIAFLLGLGLGNFAMGVPLNASFEFTGTFSTFFRPYAVLVGFTSLSLFMMHGAIYLTMKTENEVHDHVQRWVKRAIAMFVLLYAATTVYTILLHHHMIARLLAYPWIFAIPAAAFFTIMNVIVQVRKKNNGWAFLSSCFSILLLLVLFGLGTFPMLVLSTINPEAHSLTIYNASSSVCTLKTLLLIVAIGIPLVIAYMCWLYRIFRGKVKVEPTSY